METLQNIPRSDLYFFNNQYDDYIVRQALIDFRKTNFYKCLKRQEVIQSFESVHGRMSDFKVDLSVNALLGIPKDSRTLHLSRSIVPYYSKKLFLDKYDYYQPISLREIMENPSIFNTTVLIQIGNTFCFGVMIAESSDGCYLIIQKHRTNGLTEAGLQKYLDANAKWHVIFQNHADAYYTYKSAHQVFTNNVDPVTGKYLINFDILTNVVRYNKPNMTNNWVVFMGVEAQDENIMCGTTHAEVVELDGKKYLAIDKAFINYVSSKVSNCKLYCFNQYQKHGHIVVPTNNSNEIIVDLPYINNPIHPANIHVYAYENDTALKTHSIEFNAYQNHPTIFTLTLKEYDDLPIPEYVWIEWYESLNTPTKYDNAIQEVIDFCRSNNSTYYAEKSTGKLSTEVSEYEPTNLSSYDYDAFMKFEEYPDIRSFRLDRLIESLKENPDRYKTLQRLINGKNKYSIRHEYNQSKSPDVFSRSVMDTSGQITDPHSIYKFNEPMMYVKVHLADDIKPTAIIFVNGLRVDTEYTYSSNREAYFYFKRTHIKNDIENIIDIEVFLHDSKLSHKQEAEMTFYSTGVSMIVNSNQINGMVDINNLMVYDKQTRSYLEPGEITYRYTLNKTEIQAPSGMLIDLYFLEGDNYDFFLTSDEEYVVDDIGNYLTVRQDNQIEDIPDDSNKPLEVSRIFTVLNSAFRLNKALVLTNVNNYRKVVAKDGTKEPSIEIRGFKESPDYTRFRVYYGGKLLNDTDYNLSLPKKYAETVTATLLNVTSSENNKEYICEYLPVNETILYEGIADNTIYRDGLFWFDTTDFVLLPEMLRIYINGVRIPMSKVEDIGALNVFKIDGYKDGDFIQIFIPANDRSCFNFESAIKLLNIEMEENDKFRDYMVDTE